MLCEVIMASKLLMEAYPVPIEQQTLDRRMRQEINVGLNGGFEIYDWITFGDDGYVLIEPSKFEQKMTSLPFDCQRMREDIIKKKLQWIMDNIHTDGLLMDQRNIADFFRHYIGWQPSQSEVDLVFAALQYPTKRYPENGQPKFPAFKPLRSILSYEEMLICALQSVVCPNIFL